MAVAQVREQLLRGDLTLASEAFLAVCELALSSEPRLVSEEEIEELRQMMDTVPSSALQVLRYSRDDPFAAIGLGRLTQARTLNQVNRRAVLKQYRKLALELHPDRCDHPLAVDAMQALNTAYDQLSSAPPARRPPPRARR